MLYVLQRLTQNIHCWQHTNDLSSLLLYRIQQRAYPPHIHNVTRNTHTKAEEKSFTKRTCATRRFSWRRKACMIEHDLLNATLRLCVKFRGSKDGQSHKRTESRPLRATSRLRLFLLSLHLL